MCKPKFLEGILMFVLSVLILFTVGSYVQNNFGLFGLLLSQVFFVLPPVCYVLIKKLDFVETFKIKKPKIKHLIGSMFLWIGGYFYIMIITNILIIIFPDSLKSLEALNEALMFEDSFLLNLIIVAVCPAICEEFLFRGFIMSSFSNKKEIFGVIISSILFGLLHIYFIKIIPTALLGFLMGYSVYKSKSIFTGSFIHFLNNAFSVVMMFLSQKTLSLQNSYLPEATNTQMITFIGGNEYLILAVPFVVSTLFLVFGFKLLNKN